MSHGRSFSSAQIKTTRGVQSPPLEAVIEEITHPKTESSIPRLISLTEKTIKKRAPSKQTEKESDSISHTKVNTKNLFSSKPLMPRYGDQSSRSIEIHSKGLSTAPVVELSPAVYYRTRTSFLRDKKLARKTPSVSSSVSRPSITSDISTFKKIVSKSKRIGISDSRPLLPQTKYTLSSSKESLRDKEKIYTMVYNLEQSSHDLFSLDSVLENRWIISEKICSGRHFQVYKAYDKNLEREVIVKAAQNRYYSLDTESALLRALENRENIVKYISYEEKARIPFLVVELEGPNFGDIKKYYGPLSMNTVINVGIRMLDALEKLHARGWIHTNITPSSFTIGNHPHKWRQITLNDYGLSRRATRSPISSEAPENKTGMFSDPQFASVNVLNGREFDKRDDLWSLVYVLLYLKSEKLPWSSHTDKNVIRELKESTINDIIIKNLGATFKKMANLLNNLRYAERPDYSKIGTVFNKVRQYYTLSSLDKFEWENNPNKMWVLKKPPKAPRG